MRVQQDARNPVDDLTSAAKLIAEKIDKDARSRRIWHICIAVGIALVLVIGWQQLQLQQQSRERGLQNREVITRIEEQNKVITDCTSSDGECYRRNQARTAQVLGQVTDNMVIVAGCLRDTRTDAELAACVDRKLAGAG